MQHASEHPGMAGAGVWHGLGLQLGAIVTLLLRHCCHEEPQQQQREARARKGQGGGQGT